MCSQPSRIASAVSVGSVPIAEHDVRAAGEDFAFGGDAHFDARNRPADGAQPWCPIRCPVAITGEDSVSP